MFIKYIYVYISMVTRTRIINLTLDEDIMKRFDMEESKSGLIRELLNKYYYSTDLSMEQLKALKKLEEEAKKVWKNAKIQL